MKFYELGELFEWNYGSQWATRADAEQVEKERDDYKRKGEELCQAHGQALMELSQAKRDAVEMAKMMQVITVNQLAERYPQNQ